MFPMHILVRLGMRQRADMDNVKIVSMNSFQIESVYELERECFAHPWSKDSLEEYLNNPSAYFYTAVLDDKVVGYIGTYIVADESYVTNIAVTESARKRGIGKALVLKALENSKNNGASFLSLEVRLSNTPAITLYRNCGFESEGIRPKFYRDPEEDALIMTKRFIQI